MFREGSVIKTKQTDTSKCRQKRKTTYRKRKMNGKPTMSGLTVNGRNCKNMFLKSCLQNVNVKTANRLRLKC